MMEALLSSKTSVITRAMQHSFPEDGILFRGVKLHILMTLENK
jgi:hypothetical protein